MPDKNIKTKTKDKCEDEYKDQFLPCLSLSLFHYLIHFQVNLDPGVLKTFLYAVKNHYWYQMYLDDLPIWGIVGEIEEKGQDFYIWTHKKFEIGWNGDQIVDVNLTSEGRTKLHLSTEKLEFTYEVSSSTKRLLNFRL